MAKRQRITAEDWRQLGEILERVEEVFEGEPERRRCIDKFKAYICAKAGGRKDGGRDG